MDYKLNIQPMVGQVVLILFKLVLTILILTLEFLIIFLMALMCLVPSKRMQLTYIRQTPRTFASGTTFFIIIIPVGQAPIARCIYLGREPLMFIIILSMELKLV